MHQSLWRSTTARRPRRRKTYTGKADRERLAGEALHMLASGHIERAHGGTQFELLTPPSNGLKLRWQERRDCHNLEIFNPLEKVRQRKNPRKPQGT
jgi:hypothetical protein